MIMRHLVIDEELLKEQRLRSERRRQLERVLFEIQLHGKSDVFAVLANAYSLSGSADVRQHLYRLTNSRSVRDWLHQEVGVPKRLLSEKNLCAYADRWLNHLLRKDGFFAKPSVWDRVNAHAAHADAERPG